MAQRATLYDGQNAVEHLVAVEAAGEGLALSIGEATIETVPASQLVRLYSVRDRLRLGRRDRRGWRLLIDAPADPAIAALIPRETGSLAPRINRKAAAIGIAASSLVVGLIASVFIAPQLAARQMPMALERRLGDAVKLPDFVARCENPDAVAALGKMVDRLDPEARSDGFVVEIVDLPAVNAVALPGGRILVFSGLIEAAGTADAVAGVVAHEIAHVRERHVASAAIRQLGITSVVAVMGGGDLSTSAGGLLALKFSRGAEAEADDEALAILRRAKINPRPTASMLERMQGMESQEFGWLASHPATAGRAKLFADSHSVSSRYRPVLDGNEEEALFDACSWQYRRYGGQSPAS